MIQNAGTTILTASGVVGISGKPTRVFCVNVHSGATAGNATFKDGTTAAGTAGPAHLGTINQGVTFPWPTPGFYFPSGCYASFDANVTRCVISYNHP